MVPKVEGIGIQEINSIFCHIIGSISEIEHGCQHRLWKLGQSAIAGLKNLPTDVNCDDRIKAITLDRIRHFENWKLSKFVKIQKFFSKMNDFGMFGKSSRALGKEVSQYLSQTNQLSFCGPGLPRNKLGKRF